MYAHRWHCQDYTSGQPCETTSSCRWSTAPATANAQGGIAGPEIHYILPCLTKSSDWRMIVAPIWLSARGNALCIVWHTGWYVPGDGCRPPVWVIGCRTALCHDSPGTPLGLKGAYRIYGMYNV